jgi:hypothetical protein
MVAEQTVFLDPAMSGFDGVLVLVGPPLVPHRVAGVRIVDRILVELVRGGTIL